MQLNICMVSNLKELAELNQHERYILFICGDTCGYSLSCRVPLNAIKTRLRRMRPKTFRRSFHTLLSNGFVRKHPSSRNPTYELTRKGLKACNILRDELHD